ncbi:cation-translocating P-type ATPase [Chthonobacter albigriseus]|uniref:cation-translocating P-type ATPase n=1 Tax=Chthonobacter albigriseus TaxID=1683161 RepID=UPI0015EF6EDC|nr:cation-translocating P-type ATPase [Chthonobacter albigriseus]
MSVPPLTGLPHVGLTTAEAAERLRTDGYNELPRPDRRTTLRILGEVVREPMLALLLGGGLVYLLLGDLKEALILVAFATLSVAITVVQESRTERVLEALRDLTSPRALVIRDGVRRRIAGREVVRGDLLVLAEGDRVPADALLVEAHDLEADESLLTGESVPVRKVPAAEAPASADGRPGGDGLPTVYSGALVVRGRGIASVTATGATSEIGRIGQSLGALETEPPRLQAQTRRLVRIFAAAGALVSLTAVLLYGMLRGGWLDAILAGIALGMSMMPEEFPLVLTVFMAMGAWRISQARVLTRRAAAIETLGAATVLCTDKTGTLTENRMAIAELRLPSGESLAVDVQDTAVLPHAFDELLRTGVLACARDPYDPMERAFHDLGRGRWAGEGAWPGPDWTVAAEYGLRPDLLAVTQVWREAGRDGFLVAAKGAPEAIARLCRLDPAAAAALEAAVGAMAGEGLRVLGVARAAWSAEPFPEGPAGFAFSFLGLVGLADGLRASVPAAVAECRSAGIRVAMITGDYPVTASAIACKAGIGAGEVLTGSELDAMSEPELVAHARGATIFARIMPEQKLRIVEALKAVGETVAMTGDGVNDAPSLKAAHIGIAMGGRGTDVAREASAIVLLDDDFGSIVKAIRLGRRIYDNLRKAMGFIFAVHVPIAGLSLLPLAFGLPILFGPVHIAFLEMVIDPVCSLVFEAEREEDDVMRRPPRARDEPLFSAALVVWSILQGAVAFAVVAAVYLAALSRDTAVDEVRALTFASLIATLVALILVNRSFGASLRAAVLRPNRALVYVLLANAGMLAVALAVPAVRDLFGFAPLSLQGLAVALGAGLAVLFGLELLKPLLQPRLRARSRA